MTKLGKCRKFQASNSWSRRALPCLVPGEYLPDPTEGITKPEDLPQPKVVLRSRNYEHYSCPRCHHRCGRNNTVTRILHDVGDLIAGRPRDIHLVYSQHYCPKCRKC